MEEDIVENVLLEMFIVKEENFANPSPRWIGWIKSNLKGEDRMRRLVMLAMVIIVATPAFASGPWDGVKAEQGVRYDTGTDHPPFTSDQRGLGTLTLGGWVYAVIGTANYAVGNEVAGMAWVPVGTGVGIWREIRSNPAKDGKYRYSGQYVTGESAKWVRSTRDIGWNDLAQYSAPGILGMRKARDLTGKPFEVIGS